MLQVWHPPPLETVCRQANHRRRPPRLAPLNNATPPDDATAVFDTLCSLDCPSLPTTDGIRLDHHVYNELLQAWERRASDPRPTITVSIRAIPSDIRALGFPTRFTRPTPVVLCPAMADTGCQSCLASTSLLPQLGLTKHHLLPVTLRMTAANENKIAIAGTLALWVSSTSSSGKAVETRQIVYFSDASN